MNDRHQIINDKEFWKRLEYDASSWLGNSDDRGLRRFWIDGFLPETITDTRRGVDVEGTAWVGDGPREQHPYRFVVSVPQKMLRRGKSAFSIGHVVIDAAQQTLQIEVSSEKQAA